MVNCQEKKEMSVETEYNVQISHPKSSMNITPISDRIKTLEGIHAGLPYGSTSGTWGDSGKGWTEQHGTPIGAEIVYFSRYEDTFYKLDVDFPLDKMKDMVRRAYATGEVYNYSKPLEKYIISTKLQEYNAYQNPYSSMSDLIFGFAPKGMVVVWLGYMGGEKIEIGRYQAEVIKEDKELEEQLFSKLSISRKDMRANRLLADASPEKWDNYRLRYNWKPSIVSENKDFRVFTSRIEYYNAEKEILLRPWILNMDEKERAIPKEISFDWEVSKGVGYEGRIFFDWKETNEAFKKVGSQIQLSLVVAPDDNNIEVLLNNQPLKVDSIRIYKSHTLGRYKDSYK